MDPRESFNFQESGMKSLLHTAAAYTGCMQESLPNGALEGIEMPEEGKGGHRRFRA